MRKEWDSFKKGVWEKEINVRDFILKNYTPYEGDDSFLADATQDTLDLWDQVLKLSERSEKRRSPGYGHQDHFHHYFTWPGYLDKSRKRLWDSDRQAV